MSSEKPNIIELPEITIRANEEEAPAQEVSPSDTAKQEAGTALQAASRRVMAAASAPGLVSAPAGTEKSEPPDSELNEKIIQGQLAKESDEILHKIAYGPNANKDSFSRVMARVAREELNRRKHQASSRPWYKFWG